MSIFTTFDSPLGELLLVGEAGGGGTLSALSFSGTSGARPEWRRASADFLAIEQKLQEYFAGERTVFEFARTAHGTAFQERVWAAVETIPYGRTVSYGALAAQIGAPRDRIRAVAAAVGANPLLIVRPCHRVVGADGRLTGYAGGLERKRTLLTLEGALQPQLTLQP